MSSSELCAAIGPMRCEPSCRVPFLSLSSSMSSRHIALLKVPNRDLGEARFKLWSRSRFDLAQKQNMFKHMSLQENHGEPQFRLCPNGIALLFFSFSQPKSSNGCSGLRAHILKYSMDMFLGTSTARKQEASTKSAKPSSTPLVTKVVRLFHLQPMC